MHIILSSFDRWHAELQSQLSALDDQARAFLAWELRRAAAAIEQHGACVSLPEELPGPIPCPPAPRGLQSPSGASGGRQATDEASQPTPLLPVPGKSLRQR